MVQLNPLKWGKKKNKLKVEPKTMGGQGGRKTRYQTKKAAPILEKRTDTGVKGGQGGKKSRYSKGTSAPKVDSTSKSKGNASEIAKLKKRIKTGGASMKRGGQKRQLEKRIRALGG